MIQKLLQNDMCFRLRVDDHYPYNETFGAGPTDLWQCVAEHVGGVRLLLGLQALATVLVGAT